MLNFRIKNGYFLGSRVPTTISATHLKMHALFWSTLQQVSFYSTRLRYNTTRIRVVWGPGCLYAAQVWASKPAQPLLSIGRCFSCCRVILKPHTRVLLFLVVWTPLMHKFYLVLKDGIGNLFDEDILFCLYFVIGKDIIPTRKPLVTISSIRYKVGNTPFYCSWYKTFVFRYHKLNYVCLVVYAGRFVHISPTNHHFPSLYTPLPTLFFFFLNYL
ncbi:hypothetical protein HanXRQr2_Chr08g0326091 [Helianthus annuus]|uniref:Uncharacterized protein n=1 Tax=Helianthus annuus TaxID=4232 RepID=A0A9K3ICW9_HELAN|nr:hypothetical protein HanXRQr2_Chr08g0326091 [Helianthus annuus]